MRKKNLKMKDLIQALGKAHDCFRPRTKWSVADNGDIIISPVSQVNLETDIEIWYCFYHHMNPKFDRDKVLTAIETGDFDTFEQMQRDFSWGGKCFDGLTYLPYEAFVDANDECIGEFDATYTKEFFDLITDGDCECG
ncbi:MAG: hypothetical protein PUF41_12040 [Prevotella copri]|nr:hypothetical protein [Segatella copri]